MFVLITWARACPTLPGLNAIRAIYITVVTSVGFIWPIALPIPCLRRAPAGHPTLFPFLPSSPNTIHF